MIMFVMRCDVRRDFMIRFFLNLIQTILSIWKQSNFDHFFTSRHCIFRIYLHTANTTQKNSIKTGPSVYTEGPILGRTTTLP